MILRVGVRVDFEQGADKGNGAVVDRILKAVSNRQGHGAVGHIAWFIDGSPQGSQVAVVKCSVDLLELVVLCAPLDI